MARSLSDPARRPAHSVLIASCAFRAARSDLRAADRNLLPATLSAQYMPDTPATFPVSGASAPYAAGKAPVVPVACQYFGCSAILAARRTKCTVVPLVCFVPPPHSINFLSRACQQIPSLLVTGAS